VTPAYSAIGSRPTWASVVRAIPTPVIVIATGAIEYGLAASAGAGLSSAAVSVAHHSAVLLLCAGALEETVRWAVGAASLVSDGMTRSHKRLWSFFVSCVVIEGLGAAFTLWRHPPGDLITCLLAFVVLRAPPSFAHAGWTWLMSQAMRARARAAHGGARLWFLAAVGTHVGWDAATAAAVLLQPTHR
jgi:hypothetical protein